MFNKKSFKIAGSSIYISGGRGFIGNRFVEIAKYQNAEVKELDRATFNSELKLSAGTDFIIHLAGQKSRSLAAKQPVDTLMTEFRMAISLLEAARLMTVPPRKILLVSSIDVYEGEGVMSESSPDFVNSIYAAGKKNIESLGRAYAAEYGLSVIIARLANVYGPGQTKEALIPSIIEQMAENISENGWITLGNIKSVRDFVYVDDVVNGLIQLLLTPASSGEVFNISTGIGHSVEEIVLVLSDLLHYRGSINVDSKKIRLNERQVLIANNERLKSITGWRPQYSLKDGLAQIVVFYEKTKKLGANYVS